MIFILLISVVLFGVKYSLSESAILGCELIISAFVLLVSNQRKSISEIIITYYYLIISVVQPIICSIDSEILLYGHTSRANYFSPEVLLDSSLRIKYYICTTIYYIAFMLILFLVKKITSKSFMNSEKCREKDTRISEGIKMQYIFLTALIIQIFLWIFEKRYNILIPGVLPTLAHSGLYVYAIRIVTLFIWTVMIEKIIISEYPVYYKCILMFIATIIISVSRILNGSRGEMIIFIFNIIIISYYFYMDKIVLSKKTVKIIGIGVLFTFLIFGVADGIRSNEFSLMHLTQYAAARFVGYTDGMAILSYYNNGGEHLNIANFFMSSIGIDSAMPISTYYTVNMMNHEGGTHAWATPGFGTGYIYLGMAGVVTIAVITAIVMYLLEKSIINYAKSLANSWFCVILVYLYIEVIMNFVLEGTVELLFGYLMVTVVTTVLLMAVNLIKRRVSN